MSGIPGRKVVTTSLTDRHKEAFDHLQSQDGMHYSALRARAHVRRQPPLCQRDGLLIKSDASVGPFSMAADPFGTETQGKRHKFPTCKALRKKLTLTAKPCCDGGTTREIQNGTDGSKSAEQDQPGSAGDGGGRDQSAILSDILPALFR